MGTDCGDCKGCCPKGKEGQENCPGCGKPVAECTCGGGEKPEAPKPE